MTHYAQKINHFRSARLYNQYQVNAVIGLRHFINTHYEHDLNLNIFARRGHFSKFHLLRLYKKYYGQTPQQYLTERRIAQSKLLLQNGRSVKETCYAVGYESPGTFSALFKSRTGQTPSQYQKSNFQEVIMH